MLPSLRKIIGKKQIKPDSKPSDFKMRDPYFIQIGLDFGTSFSKCVCRDVMLNKAWVFKPAGSERLEFPFLIPSTLKIIDGVLEHVTDPKCYYPENGLYHLKPALVKAALSEWDDPVLIPYRNALRSTDKNEIFFFLQACAVYLIAGILGDVIQQIKRRYTGSHDKDYIAVNMAVPIADAERPKVNDLYEQVLRMALRLAGKLTGHPKIRLTDLRTLISGYESNHDLTTNDACFIYPEVSANVQGFVRSRVSSPGIYLFSDTGASTVDQSVFIFIRENHDKSERLVFLHGDVLPLGSSYIEMRAASDSGEMNFNTLEVWRIGKENGNEDLELKIACRWIYEELSKRSRSTLASAKKKLLCKDQIRDIKVIFGGGGHCEYPYKKAVMHPFSGDLFSPSLTPDVIGLPIPRDLELSDPEKRWMRRLTVAYGLSFLKDELVKFTYPVEVVPPKPDEIFQRRAPEYHAVTKEEC